MYEILTKRIILQLIITRVFANSLLLDGFSWNSEAFDPVMTVVRLISNKSRILKRTLRFN